MDRCVLYISLFCFVDIFLRCYPFLQRASALSTENKTSFSLWSQQSRGFCTFLWCYLFYKLTGEEKDNKGIAALLIVLSKNLTITALLDRVFPAIVAMNNQPMPCVTTKTVA